MFASLNAASLSLGAVPLPTVSLPTVSLPTVSLPTVSLPTISLPAISLPAISLPTITLPTISFPTTLLTYLATPIINFGDYILDILRATFSCPSMPLFCDFDAEDPEMGITLCAHHATTHSSVLAMEDYEELEDETEERMRIRCGVYTVEIDGKGWLRVG